MEDDMRETMERVARDDYYESRGRDNETDGEDKAKHLSHIVTTAPSIHLTE